MCARVERRLGGGGGGSACGGSDPSGAAAARTPAAAGEVQPVLRAPWSRREPGTGDPSGFPSPSELAGRESALPGAAAAAPPRLVADGARLRTAARHPSAPGGPGSPPPGGLRSACSRCPAPAPRRSKVVDVSR